MPGVTGSYIGMSLIFTPVVFFESSGDKRTSPPLLMIQNSEQLGLTAAVYHTASSSTFGHTTSVTMTEYLLDLIALPVDSSLMEVCFIQSS